MGVTQGADLAVAAVDLLKVTEQAAIECLGAEIQAKMGPRGEPDLTKMAEFGMHDPGRVHGTLDRDGLGGQHLRFIDTVRLLSPAIIREIRL